MFRRVVFEAKRVARVCLPRWVRSLVKDVVSMVVLNSFLTVLLLLALYHNLVNHFYVSTAFRRRVQKIAVFVSKIVKLLHMDVLLERYLQYFDVNQTNSSKNSFESRNFEVASKVVQHKRTDFLDVGSEQYSWNHKNLSDSEDSINEYQTEFVEDDSLICDLGHYFKIYGIEFETLEVETDDGFVIDIWHFVPSAAKNGDSADKLQKRHPVLLLHGLLQSSGSFASSGQKSLAYFLYKSGYDVWFGNNRCGFTPKWNENMHKMNDSSKWDWDMNHMVKYDLKAMVSTVLEKTGYLKLTLIGHSQGTTQTFMGLVNGDNIYGEDEFRLSEKLDVFVALAPAVYPGPLLEDKHFVKILSEHIDNPLIFGEKSFIPAMMFVRQYAHKSTFAYACYTMFNYLFEWNDQLWDLSLRDRHFMFSPVYISRRLMQWWLSPDESKMGFKTSSHLLFPENAQWFPLNKYSKNRLQMTAAQAQDFPHIVLFVPAKDRLVDGIKLMKHFVKHEDPKMYDICYLNTYSHMDVLWADDVIEKIGKPLAQKLRSLDSKTEPMIISEQSIDLLKRDSQSLVEEQIDNESEVSFSSEEMNDSETSVIFDNQAATNSASVYNTENPTTAAASSSEEDLKKYAAELAINSMQ